MRLFSLFYAPLNSVFEILRRAGALQTGMLHAHQRRLRCLPWSIQAHGPCLLPGYSFLSEAGVAERDECSVCYCYLFSLFFSHALITSLSASYFPCL